MNPRTLWTPTLALSALAMVTLTGCNDVRDRLGIDPEVPDEFTVLERAPLHIPPNFPLRPPLSEGDAPSTTLLSSTDQAKRVLNGGDLESPHVAPRTGGQKVLLESAGRSDTNIRKSIDEDLALQTKTPTNVIQGLLGTTPESEKTADTAALDPVAEKKRLDAAKATPTAPNTNAQSAS